MSETNELPHEPRFRFEDADLQELISEWRALGRECFDSAKEFARERPAETFAITFFAGLFLGALLRRR